jgi:hypothetical protein
MGPAVDRGPGRVECRVNEISMRFFHSLLRRLRSLRERDSSNVALSEELEFHLERQTEENIASGMSPEEAQRAAKASFGSVSKTIDDCYEARGVAWLNDLEQDISSGKTTTSVRKEAPLL